MKTESFGRSPILDKLIYCALLLLLVLAPLPYGTVEPWSIGLWELWVLLLLVLLNLGQAGRSCRAAFELETTSGAGDGTRIHPITVSCPMSLVWLLKGRSGKALIQ